MQPPTFTSAQVLTPLHLRTGVLIPLTSTQVLTPHLRTGAHPLSSAQVLSPPHLCTGAHPLTSAQRLTPSPPHRCCNWEVTAKEIQCPFLLQVSALCWNLNSCLQSETILGGRAEPLSHLYPGTPLTVTQRCRSNLAACLGRSEVSGRSLEKMEHHHLHDLRNHRTV